MSASSFDRHGELSAIGGKIAASVTELTLHAWMEGMRDGLSHAAKMLTDLAARPELAAADSVILDIMRCTAEHLSLTALSIAPPTTTNPEEA